MKISSLSSQKSFGKTLVANCAILNKKEGSYPCSIYRLDSKVDAQYFEKVQNSSEWKSARYLCYLQDDLQSIDKYENFSIYTIESKDGDCLGYSELVEKDEDTSEILFLETVPSQTFLYSYKSAFKYIGETLLAFMVKRASKSKTKTIEVHPSILSTGFYKEKCFFQSPKNDTLPYYLKRRNFKKLIQQSEEDTNASIELIG